MNKLITIIKNKDWQEILHFSKSLSTIERYSTIKKLQKIDVYKNILKENGLKLTGEKGADFYQNSQQIETCLNYFLITCTRNYEDLKKLEIEHENITHNPFYIFISTDHYQPLLEFYKLFPPDYFDKVIKDVSRDRFGNINFKILWKVYENNWVKFHEEFFVRSLFNLQGFDNDHFEDADFLMAHPLTIDKVFLKFYKYQIPILDLIKAKSIEYPNELSVKAYVYWFEVFKLLIKNNTNIDRVIISNLLESLLNNWKKPHLDWHVRLLKLFKPTNEEILENQSTLFSILGVGHPSLVNYAIQCIKSVYTFDDFDKVSFIDNLPVIFSNEKNSKSILIGLSIIEYFLSKSYKIDVDYRENLIVLLMQANTKIQEKVSYLLVEYFNNVTLRESVGPYSSFLKQKARKILEINDETGVKILNKNIDKKLQPINPITNWDELLFQVGTCIRTQNATDIDILYEGLVLLQSEMPSDFKNQLKPYTKQLFNRFWESDTMYIFSMFMEAWILKSNFNFEKQEYNPIPFFVKKTELLISKLRSKNSLPFLSTPTHKPFYIHPSHLLDKLFQYEENKYEVHLEDLIIACNRVLVSEIKEEVAKKSKNLTGYYSEAIQYFFGATNEIKYTELTLPLITQISRILNPTKIFPEYQNSPASNYPSVVKPFELDYKVTKSRLILDKNWNYTWSNRNESKHYDRLFYNTASTDKASRIDIAYQLSLNPNYLDAQLCRYVPEIASGNEVSDFEECLFPIQFILEHQLKIYHSGWLYVATCLLFEKKISRDLASEYIELAISRKENLNYLTKTIGILLSSKYAPVNRFIEYLDKPNNYIEIKQFQYQILANCILSFEIGNLPRNSKKIIKYYQEWLNALDLVMPEDIEEKLEILKK